MKGKGSEGLSTITSEAPISTSPVGRSGFTVPSGRSPAESSTRLDIAVKAPPLNGAPSNDS